jgi:tetratricopeptide (TPR) repeat protein
VVARASGNPHFAEELAIAAMVGQPGRLPPSVRAVVEARIGRLDGAAREVVALTAVAGGPTPPELLARAAGLNEPGIASALRAATDGYLLVSSPDALTERELVDVRHVLTRESIVATLGPTERRRLHAALAQALQTQPELGGSTELEQASRLVNHQLGAAETAAAVPSLRWAAGAAERALAYAEADRFYGQLLGLIDEHGVGELDEVDRTAILEHAAEAAHLAGHQERAVDLVSRALASMQVPRQATADRAGVVAQATAPPLPGSGGAIDADPDRRVRLRVRLAGYLADAGRAAEALEVRRRLLDESPAPRIQVRVLLGQARTLSRLGRREDAIATAGAAVGIASRTDSKRDRAEAQLVLGIALAMSGQTADAVSALDEAQRLDRVARGEPRSRLRPSRYPDVLRGFLERAAIRDQAGDAAGAADEALAGSDEAARLGLGTTWGLVLSATAARDLLWLGRWDEADRLTAQVRPGMVEASCDGK